MKYNLTIFLLSAVAFCNPVWAHAQFIKPIAPIVPITPIISDKIQNDASLGATGENNDTSLGPHGADIENRTFRPQRGERSPSRDVPVLASPPGASDGMESRYKSDVEQLERRNPGKARDLKNAIDRYEQVKQRYENEVRLSQ